MANTAQSTQSTVIEEQPGHATLIDQGDGTFAVLDGNGDKQYTGNEVGAEFAFWRTTLGVPVDEGPLL